MTYGFEVLREKIAEILENTVGDTFRFSLRGRLEPMAVILPFKTSEAMGDLYLLVSQAEKPSLPLVVCTIVERLPDKNDNDVFYKGMRVISTRTMHAWEKAYQESEIVTRLAVDLVNAGVDVYEVDLYSVEVTADFEGNFSETRRFVLCAEKSSDAVNDAERLAIDMFRAEKPGCSIKISCQYNGKF